MFDGDDLNLRTVARGAPGFTRVPRLPRLGLEAVPDRREAARGAGRADRLRRKTWLQIVKDMKRDHPAAEQLVYEGLKVARRTREWTIKNDLVIDPVERRRPDHGGVRSEPVGVAVVGVRPRLPADGATSRGRWRGPSSRSTPTGRTTWPRRT